MNEGELAKAISVAAAGSFSEMREAFGKEEIIGYAMLCLEDAYSCGPVVATQKGMREFSPYGTNEDFLYSPEDWDQFDNSPRFDEINRKLSKLYDAGEKEGSPGWHERLQELVFNANIRALEILIEEGYFGSPKERDGLFIMMSVSDLGIEEEEKQTPKWAERLNTSPVFQSFMTWHQAVFSNL